jgi:adenylosuccinate synthase
LRAFIVVDLGFGDAGKGLLTDFLARHFKAGVVVRYNGGAQAGHNVVAPDGRQHTFSQFGSGTFIPGVKTYLSSQVVVHPTALLVEGDILVQKGVRDAFSRIRLSEQALIITPFHQAANHMRELVRGAGRHGSCGVGVGEVVEDARLNGADSVLAGDLGNPALLRRKLHAIREQKRAQLVELYDEHKSQAALAREWQIFERDDVIDTWIASVARVTELGLVAPDALLEGWFNQAEAAVFEGAQGVLLDAEAGFHPFTTWSRCTAANALDLIQALAPASSVCKIGVMRCYAVRHGPGPLPTETDAFAPLVHEHNQYNEWQGRVRYGWLDAVLARYALEVAGKLDALAVTHLDLLPRLPAWKYCPGYQEPVSFDPLPVETVRSGGMLQNFRLPGSLTLEQRTRFTQALAHVTPLFETCDAQAEKVIQKIEALLGQAVGIISSGASAEHVKITG